MTTVQSGSLAGQTIHTARKAFACDGWSLPYAHASIKPGDQYVRGEPAPDRAGGYGYYRYCMDCAAT